MRACEVHDQQTDIVPVIGFLNLFLFVFSKHDGKAGRVPFHVARRKDLVTPQDEWQ